MKKLMLLLFLIVVFSCEDDWNFCYDCTITKKYSNGTERDSLVVLCDVTTGKTDHEIDVYEAENTFSEGDYSQECICKKQE